MFKCCRTELAIGILMAALAVMSGCGDQHNLAPVTGVVTVNDEPIAKAGVTFTPVAGGRPAWATTDEQGRFKLSTEKDGDGALIGEHVVTIAAPQAPKIDTPPPADSGLGSVFGAKSIGKKAAGGVSIDPKYANRDTTSLRFTVLADTANEAKFSISSEQ